MFIIPSSVFCSLENWNIIDSVYYCFVTLSTIGFGDYVAGLFSLLTVRRAFTISSFWQYLRLLSVTVVNSVRKLLKVPLNCPIIVKVLIFDTSLMT